MPHSHWFGHAACMLFVALSPLLGQGPTLTSPTLVGSGYTDPTLVRVSPGQIATFFVAGMKTVLSSPVNASTTPLPQVLAGISATITPETTGIPMIAPMLAVQQLDSCAYVGSLPPRPAADCLLTAVTVQVPFEVSPVPNGDNGFPADLVISESGAESKAFKIYPQTDTIHFINTCERFPAAGHDATCGSAVTHADGSRVTAEFPASAGETVVMYAFGLGRPSTPARTGDQSPMPAAVVDSRNVTVGFDFRPNASPSRPFGRASESGGLQFIGLTPGLFGVYQANVKIPATLPAIPACALTSPDSEAVTSNVTISLGGASSFDGVGICVRPNSNSPAQ